MSRSLLFSDTGVSRGIRACLIGMIIFLGFSYSEAFSEGIPADLITRSIKKLDANLIIQAGELRERIEKKEAINLVDVRTRERFDRLRIPDSINIPLYFIKTKSFLKGSPVILIDRGDQYTTLEQEAKKLRGSGFDVSILYGGVNEWAGQGYPLEGSKAGDNELQDISPTAFFEEKNYDHWLVLDLTPAREAKDLIPYALSVPLQKDSSQFPKQVRKAIKQNPGHSFILLVDKDGKEAGHLQPLPAKGEMKNVYYLSGGVAGYKQFLTNLADSRNHKDGRPKKITTAAKKGGCGGG